MSNVFTIRSILTGEEAKVLDFHRDAIDPTEKEGENLFRVAAEDSYMTTDNDSAPLQFSSLLNGNKTSRAG